MTSQKVTPCPHLKCLLKVQMVHLFLCIEREEWGMETFCESSNPWVGSTFQASSAPITFWVSYDPPPPMKFPFTCMLCLWYLISVSMYLNEWSVLTSISVLCFMASVKPWAQTDPKFIRPRPSSTLYEIIIKDRCHWKQVRNISSPQSNHILPSHIWDISGDSLAKLPSMLISWHFYSGIG